MASHNRTPNRQTGPGMSAKVPRILSAESQQMMQLTLMRLDVAKHILGELAAIDLHQGIQFRNMRVKQLMETEMEVEDGNTGVITKRKYTEEEATFAANQEGMDLHQQGYAQAALSYADHLLAQVGLVNLDQPQQEERPSNEPPSTIVMP